MSDSIKEALREFLRVVVLAVIPVIIVSLEANQVDVKSVAIVGVVAGLRFVDKYLYESKTTKHGLTQF